MELQSKKFEKILEILPPSEEFKTGKIMPSFQFTSKDIEHLSIIQLNQWKSIGLYNSPPEPLVDLVHSIDHKVVDTKKRPRDEAIELSAKAQYELSNLTALTRLIVKSSNQLIQPHYRPTNILHAQEVYISSEQKLSLKKQYFGKVQANLSNGLVKTTQILQDRSNILQKVNNLGKYWRLITSASNIPFMSNLSIDCSYVTYGDHQSTLNDYIVPLTIDKSVMSVDHFDLNRTLYTIEIQLCHARFGLITAVNAFDSNIENGNNISEIYKQILCANDLESIHNHCIKRKHDALCGRLFGRMRFHASEAASRCRWLLRPYQRLPSPVEDITENCFKALKDISNEYFYEPCELWSIERGTIVIGLSMNIYCVVSLVRMDDRLNISNDQNGESSTSKSIQNALKSCVEILLKSFEANKASTPIQASTSSNSDASIDTVKAVTLPTPLSTDAFLKRNPIDDAERTSVGNIFMTFCSLVRNSLALKARNL